jgi:hypothetical protein
MASESTALSTDSATPGASELPPSPESRRSERRLPSARETLATLPELDAGDYAFEPHDTIPAPTWLDDDAPPAHEAP